MKLLEPGAELDGFTIEECIHAGGMAHIYHVRYSEGAHDPGFPLAMKVPRMTAGDGAENIVSFEVEYQIMQVLTGSHVPRFVAAGDLENVPYLVMNTCTGKHSTIGWKRRSDRRWTSWPGSALPWRWRCTVCTSRTRCTWI